MPWQEDWTKTQQELSAASRNDHWWKTLPQDRRSILGREEYRKQCRLSRQRLKLADERCRTLIRGKRNASDDGASA